MFIYGKQNFPDAIRGQENCYLLTNGLGGFSSQNIIGGASRNDHAVLMACTHAPNHRWNIIHRLEEIVRFKNENIHISSQQFANGLDENGVKNLSTCEIEAFPKWLFELKGVSIEKSLAMVFEENTVGVSYKVNNLSGQDFDFIITPWLQFVRKGQDLNKNQTFEFENNSVKSAGLKLNINTNGDLNSFDLKYQKLFYDYDAPDGRRDTGLVCANHNISCNVKDGEQKILNIVFSLEDTAKTAQDIFNESEKRYNDIQNQCGLKNEVARQLAVSADAFISKRESTNAKTILAGYPFFEDWGRDTMIALVGCTLSTKRFEDAKSILKTFMEHEKDGLMPNLFPEGGNEPLYNTVDAALLFINCIWLYYQKTNDLDFVKQSLPIMENIINGYYKGTKFNIHMDTDYLITAGEGLDQVTWMDVRFEDILPTPRHGKPVEINAYWYNALKIMQNLYEILKKDSAFYKDLAEEVKQSFNLKFWNEKQNCLKDVISGTNADYQIRCNQIWAISMPFTMLEPEKEKQVVNTVFRHLYTPVGLRTLSPYDDEFKGFYGGEQKNRDLAYHQGTVWPFPLGAYYLAYIKVYGEQGKQTVKNQLKALIPALKEGCASQLPEVYDGENPTMSKGCFAQAWSVGELLRVYEVLEQN